ncbi:glycosyltransferase, partial [Salmonella enterica subsp. enterica serovar Vitkin]|nr:glycosyltransferase [Salmonella enterica subsp. enterica serovar Vitkin]
MAVDMVSVGQVGDAVTGAVCVVAVVVTYNPDPETFGRLLAASSREVTAIVVVDNGSSQVNVEELCEPDVGVPVEYLPRTSNVGIASAQNCGIAKARILQATHVLLLDHDSIPQSGMVRALIEAD